MAVNLAVLPLVEHLSSKVIRILGSNPGLFTLQGTNTYLIGTGKKRILLDCGEKGNSTYLSFLGNILKTTQSSINQILITHWHPDHIGGLEDVVNLIDETKKIENDEKIEVFKYRRLSGTEVEIKHNKIKMNYLTKDQHFETEGAKLRSLHTPGHTNDHMSVILEDFDGKCEAIFTGDCVLGEGSCVFEDLHSYLESLELLKKLNPNVIYPGHGKVVYEANQHICSYIDNRMNKEKAILHFLKNNSEKGSTIVEITDMVYPNLNESLKFAAARNVKHHLEKLKKDKIVLKINRLGEIESAITDEKSINEKEKEEESEESSRRESSENHSLYFEAKWKLKEISKL